MQFFVKLFSSLMTSWIADDPTLMHVTQSLLPLCDEEGVVNMDYPAIAKWTGWPIEVLIAKMEILSQPQPRSRDQDYEGRTIVRIDPSRPWGWRFVNFKKYRAMRDPRERKDYKKKWDRTHRKRKSDTSDTSDNDPTNGEKGAERGATRRPSDRARQNPTGAADLPSKSSDTSRQMRTGSDQNRPNQNKSTEVPPTVPQGGQAGLDFEEAKVFFHALFRREKRAWSYEEQELLYQVTPIERRHVLELKAWFSLPDDHLVFQKTKRRQNLVSLLRDLNGELDKIQTFGPDFGLKQRVAQLMGETAMLAKKPEPPRWPEFFAWKYPEARRQESSFWDYPPHLRKEYDREFAAFEKENPPKAA